MAGEKGGGGGGGGSVARVEWVRAQGKGVIFSTLTALVKNRTRVKQTNSIKTSQQS